MKSLLVANSIAQSNAESPPPNMTIFSPINLFLSWFYNIAIGLHAH